MLENIRDAVRKFLTGSTPYEKAVDEFIKELQKSLISSDVNVKLVFSLTAKIKERLNKEKPPSVLERKEWFISIVYDELSKLFGGDKEPNVNPTKLPFIIMLVGVQGSGKTTTAGKLAYFYKRRGYKVGLVAADVYRPAAYDQLLQLGNQIGVPVYGEPNNQNAIEIAKKGVDTFVKNKMDIIIVDTAGRHGYGEETKLLEEMKEIYEALKPDDVILVIDASIGQKAYDLASRFHQASPIGSIIITKMDGTAKGGGALSAVAATGATIKFIGTGEKIDELEIFNAKRYVSRILGMGDIESILEKVKGLEEYEKIQKKMEDVMEGKGKLTLRDVYAQIMALRKMGPLSKVLQHIPGLGVMLPTPSEDQLKLGEEKIRRWLAALNSMTYKELENPSIIDKSRMRRIAEGSGLEVEDVRELLEWYNNMNKLLKMVKRRRGSIDKLFGGKIG
ncbi:GTP-binding signal recognition particle SRP54 G- domain protein [Sulfolobus islandicus Y.G.57.14]|jgi:signal recognition particle subunit SRP54|uniref:Signal recognition particle 54 kDa protein n=2 Tax=Saccharolobus islandicus TaxID=43080 RepID=SRP54_SACI7|nr:signal recognition particle protein Srp54 [Sulfolobus islandicus]C3NDW4.1 RecName: Full=Signal recognition particle 54 kDa protein; Short=SRP54 [Sulfolobus islandicus Y.G.57.14]ACP45503.1 GTP-binding signal recognition particle SRP54 G- domain protein [Sulfolobus islandicus Y.G.57.14]ADB87031.1 GTP-binding signal recognition particle SRP54, G- domain protein [Sulfolobus islandicus L.D.8.5]PVU78561.1 signal recognition particle protein [Sulfolobus islandicus]